MAIPFLSSKYKKPFKVRMLEFMFTLIFVSCIVIGVYLYFDSTTDREYIIADSQSQIIDSSYRKNFDMLVEDVEAGNLTGIPTYDDSGVTYGDTIEITKGSGDFATIGTGRGTSAKSYTWYNSYSSGNAIKWSTTSYQYIFAYSKLMHQNSTLYDRSGVMKLFDRYNWVAMGSYWAAKFGLPIDQGATYRINLDTGKSYDVIVFDVKSKGNSNSIKDASGAYSIGHTFSTDNSCITEFDLLNLEHNYPVLAQQDSQHPEMRYEELVTLKDDPSHVKITGGSLDVIPEFQGNVISVQLIKDPKVEQLFKEAEQEVQAYK